MAVSDHDSIADRVPGAHLISRVEMEMQPPAPPRLAIPILLLIGVSVAVAATVLLANDRRNLHLLAEALHLQPTPPEPRPAQAHPTAGERPETLAPYTSVLAGAPLAPLQAVEPAIQPREFCESFRQEGQEPPAFTQDKDGGWDCSLLREYSADHGKSSAFLQIRGGAKGMFSSFRLKFNLSPAGMTAALLDEGLQLISRSIRPLWADDSMTGWMRQKLEEKKDFSAVAGYYPAILEHELSDPNRLNLVVMNRPASQIEPLRIPASWIELVPRRQPAKPRRGSRIDTESSF